MNVKMLHMFHEFHMCHFITSFSRKPFKL